jgi:hypothetical protein
VLERVDGVGEAALLADLVEQAGAHRAAEQRRVDRERGALGRVGGIDLRPVGDPQVRLVGVAGLDEGGGGEGRRGLEPAVRRDRGEAAEQLLEAGVGGQRLQVADHERAAAGAGPLTLAEGDDGLAREGAQVLLRSEHGTAERVVAERGAVDEVLGEHGGLVVGARDLLDDDAALAVELLRVDLGRPTKSVSRSIASPTTSARQVMWKATRSCEV